MLRIFKEADKKQETITSLYKRYGISRMWFYKWKKRRDKEGDEGLRSKIRKAPKMPDKVPEEIEKQILNFVKKYPAYGPERIEAELKSTGIFVGHSGIYNVLKRKGSGRKFAFYP